MRAKTWMLHNPNWDANIYLRYGGTYRNAVRWSNKILGTHEKEDGHCAAIVWDKDGEVCIWFDAPTDVNTIAHEVLHAVMRMMRWRGNWPLSYENEESWAYSIGWLSGEIHSRMK